MSIILPELEYVDRSIQSIRYLEHGWPSNLCRWHSHEEHELHLIVRTKGKAFVGSYVGDFKPGSLFLTGPHLPHNWITDRGYSNQIDIRDMLVQFNKQSIDHLSGSFPEFNEMRTMFEQASSGIEFVGFNATFARGHLEAIRDTRGSERIVSFLRFLVRINEHAEKKVLSVDRSLPYQGGSKQARIANVVDHLSKHFAEPISLSEVSEMAGMSSAAFSRYFQKVTDKRFVEFLNHIRIEQACSMLYACDDQVSAICYAVGFQNLANFNRRFYAIKGVTPSQYRRNAHHELLDRVEQIS